MKIAIQTELAYDLEAPTDVLLQLEAAFLPEQVVEGAHIAITKTDHFARVAGHDGIGDRIWLRAEGELIVSYSATVTIDRICADCSILPITPPHMLPGETVEYLMPSRYCPSDQFETFVEAEFGDLAGGARVIAMRDWIAEHFTYTPVSNASTTALESFVTRQGVCRDFAHVLVTLARASAIPARYVSVYAPGVRPQDFHAVAEVFLDGAWHLIDATGMAGPESIAKIGVGRDAADVSFLTTYGMARMNRQVVSVEVL